MASPVIPAPIATRLIAISLAALMGALAGFQSASVAFLLVGVAALSVVMVLLLLHRGMETLLFVVMGIAILTVGMNALRAGGVLTLSDVVLIVGTMLLAIARLSHPRPSHLPAFQPLLICTSVMLVAGFLGNLFGNNSLQGVAELFRFAASTVGLLVVIAVWRPTHAQVRILILLFTVGASASALAAFVSLRDASGRLIGLTVHSNHFGMLMLLAVGATLGLGLVASRQARRLAVANFLLVSAALVGSGSRAALVGYGVTLLVFLLVTRSWTVFRWGCALILVVSLVAVAGVSLPKTTAISRLFGQDSTVLGSDALRAEARERSVTRLDANPVTGVGFDVAKEAHDLYLQIWTAAGVLGLLAFFGIAFFMGRRLLDSAPTNPIAAGMLSAYAGYLVAAMFSTIFWDRYLWAYIALAWLVSLPAQRPDGADPAARTRPRWAPSARVQRPSLSSHRLR